MTKATQEIPVLAKEEASSASEIAAAAMAQALKAHAGRDLVTAQKLYRRALAFAIKPSPEIYANYGALLRELQRPKESAAVYRRGLKEFSKDLTIIRNFGNLLLQEGHAKSTFLISES